VRHATKNKGAFAAVWESPEKCHIFLISGVEKKQMQTPREELSFVQMLPLLFDFMNVKTEINSAIIVPTAGLELDKFISRKNW